MFKSFTDFKAIKPSTMQMAIGIVAGKYAYQRYSSIPIYQVGAGKGKSRIIATLVLFLLLYNKSNMKPVDIIFPHQGLMERD
jgi:hypothetical protein